jgi:uncharacterized protein (DUF2062 family)
MGRLYNIRQRCRNLRSRLKHYNGNPQNVALGVAIGVFIGSTPFFPFHTIIAVVLAVLLKGSRIAAATGVWVSNPLTLPFFYFSTYKTGAFFLGITTPVNFSVQSFSELVRLGMGITWAMILGGVVIGFFLSLAAYFATLRFVAAYKSRRIADVS